MQSFVKYIPFAFSIFKTIFLQRKHDYKVKTFNKTREKIDIIENLLVKFEKKFRETRAEIEELKRQIMISRIINIILFVVVITLIFVIK